MPADHDHGYREHRCPRSRCECGEAVCVTRRSAVGALAGGILTGAVLSMAGSTPAIAKGKGQDKDKGKVKVVKRSFPELLAAQGSTSDFFDQYDDNDNKIFDSPFPDYNGWSTPDNTPAHFAYVDYAGVMANYLRKKGIYLGTKAQGSVSQRTLPDGRAHITVLMRTTRAITWVVKYSYDWVTGDLDFGYRPAELLAGRSLRPALAACELKIEFTIPTPETRLPDLGYVLYPYNWEEADPPVDLEGYQLLAYDFRALAFGAVREEFDGDVPDGTWGMARIVNTGERLDTCQTGCWPEEAIEITPFGGKSSGRQTASKGQRGLTKSAKGGKRPHGGRRKQ